MFTAHQYTLLHVENEPTFKEESIILQNCSKSTLSNFFCVKVVLSLF